MLKFRPLIRKLIVAILGAKSRPYRVLSGLATGSHIHVSPATHLGYIAGSADQYLQRTIKRYVSPGDNVYDIGANIGYVSLMLAKQVGPEGGVFAFEPIPETFAMLRRNIVLNKLDNVTLLNVAASATSGVTAMRTIENLSMSSLVWHRDDTGAVQVRIETVAIDNLIESGELPAPKFVKIDVEGAEGLVLQGMARTIASTKPVIFLECSDIGRQASWSLLCGLRYRCQSITTREWVDAFDAYRHSDFLWLPQCH
jgi:FkbM family methyltransferase